MSLRETLCGQVPLPTNSRLLFCMLVQLVPFLGVSSGAATLQHDALQQDVARLSTGYNGIQRKHPASSPPLSILSSRQNSGMRG